MLTTIFRFAAILALLAFCAACFASDDHSVGHYVGANDDLRLDAKQLQEFELAALDGDGAAGRRLALYYGFYLNDLTNELKWLTIAAENGDDASQCNLARLMEMSTEETLRHRSAFWAAKCQSRKK